MPEPGHGRSDVDVELAEHHDHGDRHDEDPEEADDERGDGVDAAFDLGRRQLAGRALGRLAVDEPADEPIEEPLGEGEEDPRERRR